MHVSFCANEDTRHTCHTRIIGPGGMNKSIDTIYECCAGYSLNHGRTRCDKGSMDIHIIV